MALSLLDIAKPLLEKTVDLNTVFEGLNREFRCPLCGKQMHVIDGNGVSCSNFEEHIDLLYPKIRKMINLRRGGIPVFAAESIDEATLVRPFDYRLDGILIAICHSPAMVFIGYSANPDGVELRVVGVSSVPLTDLPPRVSLTMAPWMGDVVHKL